ncbi:hypothetical protein PIROE2DRAFT_6523 [Piromyces sp. E2]|nr:hypothetical protein PIROE2DRAFT_6523 [Piromyces sp. E2]|eukprot:OUM66287.1 hypothetical protein PIROE2DRAFT_6523 [Piromyces sp. E2]
MVSLLQCLLNILFFIIISKNYIYAKEFIIRNTINDFENLSNIIKENQNDDELVLNFVDEYYYTPESNGRYGIDVNSNITFRGNKNGTVYDFHHERNREYLFAFSVTKGKTVKFENFIFKNYYADNERPGLYMFTVTADTDNHYLKFYNCTFQNNYYTIFRSRVENKKPTHTDPSYVFEKCNFM